jgi:deoxyribonuclease V
MTNADEFLAAYDRRDVWPPTEAELVTRQFGLAEAARSARPWELGPVEAGLIAGGCFLAFARGKAGPGAAGDRGWAAAVTWPLPPTPSGAEKARKADSALKGSGPGLPRQAKDVAEQSVVAGTVAAAYKPGFLALREGPLLAEAVWSLRRRPDVLLVDATGQDHPRKAGLAVHLGVIVDVPTVGVTHRPLVASGDVPVLERGASSPLLIDGSVVAYWVCTRTSARPVVAHAGWRTSPTTAVALVLACSSEAARTPIPLVEARRAAREARAVAEGRVHSG